MSARSSPGLPLPAEREIVEAVESSLSPHSPLDPLRPWWVSMIALNRDLWHCTALCCDGALESSILLLFFAKQSPQEACFLELREVPLSWPGRPQTNDDFDVWPDSRREFEFLAPLRVLTEFEIAFPDDACISVYEGLRFRCRRVVALHEPRPFEDFARFHPRRPPPAKRKPAGSRAKVACDVEDLLLSECPWLDRTDLHEATTSGKRPRHVNGGHRTAKKKASPPEEEPSEDDASSAASLPDAHAIDDGGEASRQLAEVRVAVALPGDDVEPYFRVHVRGGNWTKRHKDVVADCAQVKTRDSETRYWCQAFRLAASKSFSFRLYSRDDALRLAREICRRGNFFASLYFDSVDDDFVYTEDHVTACGDDLDFVTWLCSLDIEYPSFERGQELRSISPQVA